MKIDTCCPSHVLNLNLLYALPLDLFNIPPNGLVASVLQNPSRFAGQDLTRAVASSHRPSWRAEATCLMHAIKVGEIDTESVGCIASDIVLYVSLVVILGVILVKFVLAVIFGWCLSWKLGNFKEGRSYKERMKRDAEIEDWTQGIYRPAEAIRPHQRRYSASSYAKPKKRKTIMPRTSRFTQPEAGSTHFNQQQIERPVSAIWRNSPRYVKSTYKMKTLDRIKKNTRWLIAPSFSVTLPPRSLANIRTSIDQVMLQQPRVDPRCRQPPMQQVVATRRSQYHATPYRSLLLITCPLGSD